MGNKSNKSPSFYKTQASTALYILAESADTRENVLDEENSELIRNCTDDENDSITPIFDDFYEQGSSKAIPLAELYVEMTNIDLQRLEAIWMGFKSFIDPKSCNGGGKKHLYPERRFLTVSVLKLG